jgi:hypothetical protein
VPGKSIQRYFKDVSFDKKNDEEQKKKDSFPGDVPVLFFLDVLPVHQYFIKDV